VRPWNGTRRRTFERELADFSLLSPEAEKHLNFNGHQIQPLESFSVGPYSLTVFPADDALGMGALLYGFEVKRPGGLLRYGHGCAI
jgi:hypothetical protein